MVEINGDYVSGKNPEKVAIDMASEMLRSGKLPYMIDVEGLIRNKNLDEDSFLSGMCVGITELLYSMVIGRLEITAGLEPSQDNETEK